MTPSRRRAQRLSRWAASASAAAAGQHLRHGQQPVNALPARQPACRPRRGNGSQRTPPPAPPPAESPEFAAWAHEANDLGAPCTLCGASPEDPFYVLVECTHPDGVAVRDGITSCLSRACLCLGRPPSTGAPPSSGLYCTASWQCRLSQLQPRPRATSSSVSSAPSLTASRPSRTSCGPWPMCGQALRCRAIPGRGEARGRRVSVFELC